MYLRCSEGTYSLVSDAGWEQPIQTDVDIAVAAHFFGWVPCECDLTDGTVDCDHRTASQMIGEAKEYLAAHVGESTRDAITPPGYEEFS
jgi:hypothetical protein